MPLEFAIGRDRETDFDTTCTSLEQGRWTSVEGPINEIKVNSMQWADVSETRGTLFEKGDGARIAFPHSPASGQRISLRFARYAYVAPEPVTWFMNRTEAGSIIPVFDYR